MTPSADDRLVDRLEAIFHRTPDRVFIERPGAPDLTFGDVWDYSSRYANLFACRGIRPGDRVIYKAKKSAQFILVYLACLRGGVIFLPVNPAFTADETNHILADADPALLITDDPQGAVGFQSATFGAITLTSEDAADGAAAQSSIFVTPRDLATDTPAVILYTSGTTGRPKGATLSHGNILANGLALVETWRFGADDVLLHALPLFHSHGLFVSLSCSLLTASRVLLLDRFDPDLVVANLPRATIFMGVPTMYVRLADDDRLTPDLCRTIRLFASGSAALSPKTFDKFERRSGCRIVERYGMTETAINSSNPIEGERRVGTVGRPLAGIAIEIRDASGTVLPGGIAGAVHVRGPHVFLDYWGKPDQTAAVKSADGWFETGDIGVLDEDGYLTLIGRSKDLIITGGYNVYPAEVERVLGRDPDIKEASVVGLPHDDLGEAVTAIAAAETGAAASESAIRERARLNLAGYKIPKKVVFVDDLPRNHLGKVDKRVLRERYKDLYVEPR